jgi:hypothetical protein
MVDEAPPQFGRSRLTSHGAGIGATLSRLWAIRMEANVEEFIKVTLERFEGHRL